MESIAAKFPSSSWAVSAWASTTNWIGLIDQIQPANGPGTAELAHGLKKSDTTVMYYIVGRSA